MWPGRKPSVQEIQNCTWVHMTPEATWDPHSEDFAENESIADGHSDRSISSVAFIMSSINAIKLGEIQAPSLQPASLMDGLDFARLAQETVTVSSANSGTRRSTIRKEELAKIWGIGLEAAERTIQATTQLVVRVALHPIQMDSFIVLLCLVPSPFAKMQCARFS